MRRSMRSSLTSSPAAHKQVHVYLLNSQQLTLPLEGKAKVKDIFGQVCEHLRLREVEYFGLAQKIDDDFQFLDGDIKLQKLLPRSWKILSKEDDKQVLTLYFRVKFYVDHISLLKERVTRQLYYQQLKHNLLNYNQLVSEEKCFLLAQYALHADFGNYNPRRHDNNYFDPREYFPAWVVSKHGTDYIARYLPTLHNSLSGMTKGEAQLRFICDVNTPPTAHNLHFYRLKKRKTDGKPTVWLGICPAGIEIYEEVNGFCSVINKIIWSEIDKLYFDKKKFEIKSTECGRKLQFFTFSEDWSKYLLSVCQETHIFSLSQQSALAELKHLEAEDRKYTNENYIYSDQKELEHGLHTSIDGSSSGLGASSNRTNRISVISNTSSNTTSGIVSDRLHTSLDESEDAASHEIIIDSPPSKASNSVSGLSRTSSQNSGTTCSSGTKVASLYADSYTSSQAAEYSEPLPRLKPAMAHIERFTFAPTQMANSFPVANTQQLNSFPAPNSQALNSFSVASSQQQQLIVKLNQQVLAKREAELQQIIQRETELKQQLAAKRENEIQQIAQREAELQQIAQREAELQQITQREAELQQIAQREAELQQIAQREAELQQIAQREAELQQIAQREAELQQIAQREADLKQQLAVQREAAQQQLAAQIEAEQQQQIVEQLQLSTSQYSQRFKTSQQEQIQLQAARLEQQKNETAYQQQLVEQKIEQLSAQHNDLVQQQHHDEVDAQCLQNDFLYPPSVYDDKHAYANGGFLLPAPPAFSNQPQFPVPFTGNHVTYPASSHVEPIYANHGAISAHSPTAKSSTKQVALNSKLSVSLGDIAHHRDCPKHALAAPELLREVSSISTGAHKLPFITALCNDKSLINTCTCRDVADDGRPLSWSSGQLSGTLRVVDDTQQRRQRSVTVAGVEGIGRFLPPYCHQH